MIQYLSSLSFIFGKNHPRYYKECSIWLIKCGYWSPCL